MSQSNTASPSLLARVPLWQQILVGLVLGVVVGMLYKPGALALAPVGALFLNAIKMLIVPLVFISLVAGITAMSDSAKLGRISVKTIAIYLITTAFAVSIGLAFGTLFSPGEGMHMVASGSAEAKQAPSLVQILVGLVPTNPVTAFAEGNILQIIVFAIALGVSMNLVGEKAAPAIRLFDSLAEVLYKLTDLVMRFAPIGVFALIAGVVASHGIEVLLPLAGVIGVIYLASIAHMLLVYGSLIGGLARLSPLRFFRGIAPALAVAFSTSSSSGTLPVSIECARKNLGVSQGVAGFVLPVGATINMDGTAIYQGVLALFIAQAFGIDLSAGQYLMIILTATLASVGTAGIPGAGLIMLGLVLSSVGLPLEGVALIAGIDRILDMARTTVNVTGDLMTTTLVARSENELDRDVYNSDNEA
ncbi:Proton glutamate symport protein [Pseudomonas sp. THAF187a]|uniref:Dicarboxylate/amino acid:cation symporter n=2 Tax=Ectopseudomonas khazarica TaxID=2502979 RepID=A0ABW7MDL1_9GAMM|nr:MULTISPECIES: dicarboxylate/amino acid:cation symporter [unclassified Pseudomonas]QFT20067.1 Proton glutamate symport protein [Pseudomonas sp. THAF187a]QFT40258.1 Proton glutamate symport protein [Pseudomonas sp. THAF42]TNF08052.1 MAG: dicarboxylate/amino acid:cation symporter [Pseudomonadales bacterium]|tara:strand:- start:13762 stop:15015 length:1254 start_codon:yes stop_codon:yes gene_type:complete